MAKSLGKFRNVSSLELRVLNNLKMNIHWVFFKKVSMTKEWSFSHRHSVCDGNFFEIMLLFDLWISTGFEIKGFKWSRKWRARDQVLTLLMLAQKQHENSLMMKSNLIRTLWKIFANLRISDSPKIETNNKQKFLQDFN